MSEGLEWVCLQPVADAITDDLEELRWEALTRGTIRKHYGKSREGAKYKRILGVDPAGNTIDSSVTVSGTRTAPSTTRARTTR